MVFVKRVSEVGLAALVVVCGGWCGYVGFSWGWAFLEAGEPTGLFEALFWPVTFPLRSCVLLAYTVVGGLLGVMLVMLPITLLRILGLRHTVRRAKDSSRAALQSALDTARVPGEREA